MPWSASLVDQADLGETCILMPKSHDCFTIAILAQIVLILKLKLDGPDAEIKHFWKSLDSLDAVRIQLYITR